MTVKWKNIIAIILVLSTLLTSMFFLKIEVVSPGEGIVTSDGGKVEILAPNSGIVRDLTFSTGESLDAGDSILSIVDLETGVNINAVENEMAVLSSQLSTSEKDVHCLNLLMSLDNKINMQCTSEESSIGEQFSLERAYLFEQIESTELTIYSSNEELDLFKEKINNLKKQQKLIINSSASKRELLQQEALLFEEEIGMLTEKNQLNDLKFKVKEIKYQYQIKVQSEINRIKNAIDLNRVSLTKLEGNRNVLKSREKSSYLTSPVKGTILKFSENISNGTYVEKGKSLLVIDLNGNHKKIKGRINAKYRPFLNVGMNVKVTTTSPGKRNVYNSKLVNISTDSFKYDDRNENQRYFEVEVDVSTSAKTNELHEGASVTIYALTKEVSLWGYLLGLFYSPLVYSVG